MLTTSALVNTLKEKEYRKVLYCAVLIKMTRTDR